MCGQLETSNASDETNSYLTVLPTTPPLQLKNSLWYNATTAITPDGQGLILTVTSPTAGLAANATRGMFSAWPVVTVYAGDFPALPWNKGVTSSVVLDHDGGEGLESASATQ